MTTERPEPTGSLRLAVVPGATPGRWLRTWGERHPSTPAELVHVTARDALDVLRSGGADAGLVRLGSRPDDVAGFRLYEETTVVVVPRDHVVAAADEVTLAELATLTEPGVPGASADAAPLLVPADDVLGLSPAPGTSTPADTAVPPGTAVPRGTAVPPRTAVPLATVRPATTAEAIELVAAGVGVLVVPQSLARLHDRRDLTYRPVTDAPTSSVWLAWLADRTTDDVERLVGIVRGRTANSSRGPARVDEDGVARPASGAANRPGAGRSTGGRSAGARGQDGRSAQGGHRGQGGHGGRGPRRRPSGGAGRRRRRR